MLGAASTHYYYDYYVRESCFSLLPWQLDCPAALERIKEGRPITIKDDKGNTSKCIADIVSVSIFI